MGDRVPQTKLEEQFPLLKVDGGGDILKPTIVVSSGWNVISSKRSWFNRWPEYISACWMTLILLGVSFLVFFLVGMTVFRGPPIVVYRCNSPKPVSNVYYHHIIESGSYLQFFMYSDYLAHTATQYPHLQINVFFLLDDSWSHWSKILSNKVMLHHSGKSEECIMRELKEFQFRYQNVNITATLLSKFMALTPLRLRWRTIPTSFLPFHMRAFSVWENGGIGLDLASFSDQYNNGKKNKIDALLKQHNDGIKSDAYAVTLKMLYESQEKDFGVILYNLMDRILLETTSLFNGFYNGSFLQELTDKKKTPKRSMIYNGVRRSKRDIMDNPVNADVSVLNTDATVAIRNSTESPINTNGNVSILDLNITNVSHFKNNISEIKLGANKSNKSIDISGIRDWLSIFSKPENSTISDGGPIVLFYDFSVITDEVGPSYMLPEGIIQPGRALKQEERKKESVIVKTHKSQFLSLDSEGYFIAATSRQHPFLARLISGACQRMHPKFSIQDTYRIQCSGFVKDDGYCNNIFLF